MKQLKGEIVQQLPDTPERGVVYFLKGDANELPVSNEFTMYVSDDNGILKRLDGGSHDNLDVVALRDNALRREISFEPDISNDGDESIKLGISRNSDGGESKRNIWFSDTYTELVDSNSTNTSKFSLFVGTNVKSNNLTNDYSQYIGHNVGDSVSGLSTLIGSFQAGSIDNYNVNNTENVFIGHRNAHYGDYDKIQKNVVIGSNNYNTGASWWLRYGEFTNGNLYGNITLGTDNNNFIHGDKQLNLPNEVPQTYVLAYTITQYDSYVYDRQPPTAPGYITSISSINNNITIGRVNIDIRHNGPKASVSNINIGSGNSRGFNNYDMFNIYIGNHISHIYHDGDRGTDYGKGYGNIILGNFISTNDEKNSLVIHNYANTYLTRAKDALIYGRFDERYLNINGNLNVKQKLTLSPDKNDVTGDVSFNKQLVAKSDGTVGFSDRTKERYISDVNISAHSTNHYETLSVEEDLIPEELRDGREGSYDVQMMNLVLNYELVVDKRYFNEGFTVSNLKFKFEDNSEKTIPREMIQRVDFHHFESPNEPGVVHVFMTFVVLGYAFGFGREYISLVKYNDEDYTFGYRIFNKSAFMETEFSFGYNNLVKYYDMYRFDDRGRNGEHIQVGAIVY